MNLYPSYLAPHFSVCEDGIGYYCPRCKFYIEAGLKTRNLCDGCGKFAKCVDECICNIIESDLLDEGIPYSKIKKFRNM